MTDFELTHVYYNKGFYDDCFLFEKHGYFYIGNGYIFIYGAFKQLIPGNTKLNIIFINSQNKYNTNYISTNSYETIAEELIYNSGEEILDINEMIKLWHKYKNHKCDKEFRYTISFKVPKGNLLDTLYINPMKLLDYILYKRFIKEDDMDFIPFTLHKKVNDFYYKKIFNTDDISHWEELLITSET